MQHMILQFLLLRIEFPCAFPAVGGLSPPVSIDIVVVTVNVHFRAVP